MSDERVRAASASPDVAGFRSLGIFNVYPKHSGTSIVAKCYERVLKSPAVSGIRVKSVQLIEGRNLSEYERSDIAIRGLRLPCRSISVPLHRMLYFPTRVRAFQFDIGIAIDPTIVWAALLSKISIVVVHDVRPFSEHEPLVGERAYFELLRLAVRQCDLVLCPTRTVRDEIRRLGFGPERVEVCTPFPVLSREPLHPGASVGRVRNGDTLTALYVANDLPYKNIASFLRLAREFDAGSYPPRWRFVLASGRLRPETRALISELGIHNLTVLSNVADIRAVYDMADVLLFPSAHEGTGLPLIEAMMFGIPTIANDLPVIREVLGESGIIKPVSDLSGWRDAMVSLEDAATYQERSESASRAGLRYSEANFASSLVRALVKVIVGLQDSGAPKMPDSYPPGI